MHKNQVQEFKLLVKTILKEPIWSAVTNRDQIDAANKSWTVVIYGREDRLCCNHQTCTDIL